MTLILNSAWVVIILLFAIVNKLQIIFLKIIVVIFSSGRTNDRNSISRIDTYNIIIDSELVYAKFVQHNLKPVGKHAFRVAELSGFSTSGGFQLKLSVNVLICSAKIGSSRSS